MQGSSDIAHVVQRRISAQANSPEQIMTNLEHVLYMEFRGGEVFADRHSIDFIWEIARTDFAKNISLDISTNAIPITDEIIDLLTVKKADCYVLVLMHSKKMN